jgi:hypothetical protein
MILRLWVCGVCKALNQAEIIPWKFDEKYGAFVVALPAGRGFFFGQLCCGSSGVVRPWHSIFCTANDIPVVLTIVGKQSNTVTIAVSVS